MSSPTPQSTALADYSPAAVQWRCPYKSTFKYLDQVSLCILFDEPGKAAYFKLRVPASFKTLRKTHICLSFSPNRVAELQHTDISEIPECVKKTFLFTSDTITSFRFTLVQPSAVLVPSSTSLTPRNKKFGDVLEAVQSLSHATDFTVFFPINEESFQSRAAALCATIGSLSPVTSELDHASLYNGRGATVLEDCDFGLASAPKTVESPPSYDELALPEPKRPAASSSSKPPAKKLKEKEEPWAQALRELRSEVDARLQTMDASVQRQLQDTSDRLEQRVDEQLEQLRAEMQKQLDEMAERLEEVQDEAADVVDVRLDERVDGAMDALRDFVREEVKDVGEGIKRELDGARLEICYN
ncbi:hypothetical protein SLS56_011113 [Neofusicoccum ribis]|uniref:Uncharacterized protein n=1 Tax=Neofusicoccum ribis TaxID=45134 RepID=A0ABR3SE32_9PEZI